VRAVIDQKGLTLVEVVVATGIAAMIVVVLATSIFMFMRSTEQGNQQLKAYQDLQNAGHWITRDGVAAQTTNLIDGAAPVASMTLGWSDGGQSHTIIYSLSGDDLRRNHNGIVTTVARNVSSVGFSISQRTITGSVTAAPASRWGVSAVATYEVRLRTTG